MLRGGEQYCPPLGTDPGLSVPPNPSHSSWIPSGLLGLHSYAGPSATLGPWQSSVPPQGALALAAGRARLSRIEPGDFPHWALLQPTWHCLLGCRHKASPGSWAPTLRAHVACAKHLIGATQTLPRMIPTLLPFPWIKILEKYLQPSPIPSLSGHRPSGAERLPIDKMCPSARGCQGQGHQQIQQPLLPSPIALRPPKHWPSTYWQIH